MTSHPVGYDVNDVKNDGEGLLSEVVPNMGANMRLF